MTYYVFIENEKINGAGECKILNDGFLNYEVTEDLFNDFSKYPTHYTWDGEAVIKRPDEEIEAEEAQKEKEYVSKLSMTKYDLYKYVLAPSGISYAQLLEVLEGNPNLKVAWDLCAYVYRGDTDFIQGVKDFIPTMTDEILDNIFKEYGVYRP